MMNSLSPPKSTLPPSTVSYKTSKTCAATIPRTIEVNLGTIKKLKRTYPNSHNFPDYSPQIRADILAYLASTTHPFSLSIQNTNEPLCHQDISDLWELLHLAGEDRWWEINLDDAYCEECVREGVKPNSRTIIPDKIPFLSNLAQQLHHCLCDTAYLIDKQTSHLIECPHRTKFTQLMEEISHETRSRLSCLRITGSFRSSAEVGSAVHNILRLFPNIQSAEVKLPPASRNPIQNPEKTAYHMGTLENSLPKGIPLKYQNLLEHQDFMLKWVQVKRKWYQLIPNETEIAQLKKIGKLSDSEEKLMGVSSNSVNWARLNRGRRFN
ncbi:hypothetical protein K3495_g6056 [Podosphaera aphanis]|nr:hypothetical protein K3495_g6056 [Podosphaera aphanis]